MVGPIATKPGQEETGDMGVPAGGGLYGETGTAVTVGVGARVDVLAGKAVGVVGDTVCVGVGETVASGVGVGEG